MSSLFLAVFVMYGNKVHYRAITIFCVSDLLTRSKKKPFLKLVVGNEKTIKYYKVWNHDRLDCSKKTHFPQKGQIWGFEGTAPLIEKEASSKHRAQILFFLHALQGNSTYYVFFAIWPYFCNFVAFWPIFIKFRTIFSGNTNWKGVCSLKMTWYSLDEYMFCM